MRHGLVKATVLKLISMGFKAPEALIDRVAELTHLKELLNILDINCVLDVGANCGQFAHELRAIGYKGRIISFEPIIQEYSALSLSFNKDPGWSGHQIALGSENTVSQINIPDETVMSSFLASVEEGVNSKKQEVHIQRLDHIFETITKDIDTPRVFLKMDTQGYDLEVFRGAENCLEYIHGIQSELSVQPLYKDMPHYNEALEIYEKAGYELYNLSVVNRISSGGLLELNAFMRRTAK